MPRDVNQITKKRILFATPEVFPLVKTGGLADVSFGLPNALEQAGEDVRLVLPAYQIVKQHRGRCLPIATLQVAGHSVRILERNLPGSRVKVWLVDLPEYFDRSGGPYSTWRGVDWPDNAERFAAFCRVIVELAQDRAGLDWRPDVVHCNDWQTGLVPALLSLETQAPATVFTIHNLAYQGNFSRNVFESLDLPAELWSMQGVEFHGLFSFIKGGLAFADMLNTVSPTYAREIRTPAFGYGLEGLLDYRGECLAGILNGVDYKEWNPGRDKYLPARYSYRTLARKAINKEALQAHFGLPQQAEVPLIGVIGRLAEQKGFDLVLAALNDLLQQDIQIVMLGTGDKRLEMALATAAATHPQQLAVHVGFNEELAHLIEGGADMFLMPSRYEPCGLNQIYSLRYGTIPIVHHTGGLADSVVDTNEFSLADGSATGFHFHHATPAALSEAVLLALRYFRQPRRWRRLARTAMAKDFSWPTVVGHYQALYLQAISNRDSI